MNKKLIYIAAAALGTAALAACDDDFAYPPIVEPESQWAGKENTTIRQVKEEYWQNTTNYGQAVGLSESGEEVILRARVISSDATGNIYNNLFIQEINEDGTPGQAMAIASRTKNKQTKLAAQFPFGAEVCLNLSGVYVGRFAGLFQAGMLSGTEISFMTNDVLLEHLELNSLGKPELVDTMTVDLATLKAAKSDDEQLRYYMGRLVRMDGVTFQNAGQPFAATQTENRYVTDAGGNRMNVRCNNQSTWHDNIIPGGPGSVVGILSYFNNDWQVLMIDEKGCIGFDPSLTPEPAPDVEPEGEGTQASPYNVAKALEVTNALAADKTTETDFYVKGKISAIDEIDTGSFGNATYSIVDVDGGTPFKIFRGYWLNGDKFTAADQLAVGAEVIVVGKLVNFKGNTPEMAQGNRVYSYNGQTGGGDNPTPDPTPGNPEGDGSEASPFNVAATLAAIAALPDQNTTAESYYIKGKISAIKEVETVQYGNATYSIVDVDGGTALTVFRGYWLNGDKFTSKDQLAVGAEVVIYGKLVNYMGNTPEVAQGNKIISYNGQTSVDPTPDPDPDPTPDPGPDVPAGDAVDFAISNFPHGDDPNVTGNVSGPATFGGYIITTETASGKTAPAINVYNGVPTLRLYANNTLTVKGASMAKIVFTINTATGAKRYTTFTPSVGSINPVQAAGDSSITWKGDASDITFTVGALGTLGTESSKPGQVHISKIEIYPVK
ncbi:MAG: hypothetical protein J6J20_08925 [Muribaculaceae bacterium]|nr:hypothetical protein [Muribaculaceae bacterium]